MTHHRPANPANTSNFKYLIFEISISVVSEEIPLDFYSRILGKQHCAFSRLIKRTTDNICGANTPPIEHAGKAVNDLESRLLPREDIYRRKRCPKLDGCYCGRIQICSGDGERHRWKLSTSLRPAGP